MLAYTLSKVRPSTALQELCLSIYFAPIGHKYSFHPFAVGYACWRAACPGRTLLKSRGNCIGDSRSDFRPLVAAKPPFVAAQDLRHDLGVVCQS